LPTEAVVFRFTVFTVVVLQIAWTSISVVLANNVGHKNDDEQLTLERIKEIMDRLHKNLEASEDRLGKKDPGATTREIQEQIIKDLDALLKQKQDQGSSPNNSGKRVGRENPQREKKPTAKAASDPSTRPDAKALAGVRDKHQTPEKAVHDGDWWGPSLPKIKRLEMDVYSKERFLPRYEELLRQYYRTIAEQGRRQEGD
jgi:hypothetical protein